MGFAIDGMVVFSVPSLKLAQNPLHNVAAAQGESAVHQNAAQLLFWNSSFKSEQGPKLRIAALLHHETEIVLG
jgi:hypothetical protein